MHPNSLVQNGELFPTTSLGAMRIKLTNMLSIFADSLGQASNLQSIAINGCSPAANLIFPDKLAKCGSPLANSLMVKLSRHTAGLQRTKMSRFLPPWLWPGASDPLPCQCRCSVQQDVVAMACPKPDKPELDGLRREGATPTQTADTYLYL